MKPSTLPSNNDLKIFGLIMAGMIGLLFGLLFPTIFDWDYLNIAWLFVTYFLISAFLIPSSLKYVYKIWSYLGRILNWVNTRLILGLIFLFLFIPFALFFKLITRDMLNTKFDSQADSYRVVPPSNRHKLDLTKPY